MHSKILIFFICFLSILSFKTQAYGQGHQNVLCNDCGSVDMRKRAILNGQGDVHVVDLKRNKVHKYRVMSDAEFGGNLLYTQPLSPDPLIVADVQEMSQVYSEITPTETVTVDFVARGSAYDLSGSSRNQNNFKDFFAQNWDLSDRFSLFFVKFVSMFPYAPQINLEFNVYFTDGSHVDLLVVGGNTLTGKVETIIADAKDAENNTVPLTKSGFSGEYYIRGQDMGAFTGAAERNSVSTVFLPGYNPAPSTRSVIVCSTVNGETTCTQRRVMVL